MEHRFAAVPLTEMMDIPEIQTLPRQVEEILVEAEDLFQNPLEVLELIQTPPCCLGDSLVELEELFQNPEVVLAAISTQPRLLEEIPGVVELLKTPQGVEVLLQILAEGAKKTQEVVEGHETRLEVEGALGDIQLLRLIEEVLRLIEEALEDQLQSQRIVRMLNTEPTFGILSPRVPESHWVTLVVVEAVVLAERTPCLPGRTPRMASVLLFV